jgi:hypothetical protein
MKKSVLLQVSFGVAQSQKRLQTQCAIHKITLMELHVWL